MPEDETTQGPEASAEATPTTGETPAKKAAAKKTTAKKAATRKTAAKKAPAKRAATKKAAAKKAVAPAEAAPVEETTGVPAVLFQVPARTCLTAST